MPQRAWATRRRQWLRRVTGIPEHGVPPEALLQQIQAFRSQEAHVDSVRALNTRVIPGQRPHVAAVGDKRRRPPPPRGHGARAPPIRTHTHTPS